MDRHLSPAETAKRFGISIKALRLYERHGLLTPLRTRNGSTGAAWRFYGSDQLTRLHQILALKRLGLSLGQIGDLLVGEDALDPILAFQERVLTKDSERIARALTLLRTARTKLASGAALSIDDLAALTQETVMTTHSTAKELAEALTPFREKHLTAEDRARIHEWASGHPEIVNVGNELLEEAKALMAAGDETSAPVTDFARRYLAFVQVRRSSSSTTDLAPKLQAAVDDARSDPEVSQRIEVLGFIERVLENLGSSGFREQVNETITPDEQSAIRTWMASYPPDELKAMIEASHVGGALLNSIRELLQNNVDPAAPEAQALAVREEEITLKFGLRNFAASMFEWNEPLAEKWLQATDRAAGRMPSSDPGTPDEDVRGYLCAVQAASPWHRALEPIADEAAELEGKNAQPSAPAAQALVGRLRQICANHALGDPLVYVRWARARQFRWPAEDVGRKRAGWAFLAKAIAATVRQ